MIFLSFDFTATASAAAPCARLPHLPAEASKSLHTVQAVQVDRCIHLMDSCHYSRCIQTSHYETSQSQRKCQKPLDTVQDRILRPYKDRTDRCQCQIPCHKYTYQTVVTNRSSTSGTTLCSFFSITDISIRHDNRNDMSLISNHINLIESKEYRLRCFHTFCRHSIRILQRRVNL